MHHSVQPVTMHSHVVTPYLITTIACYKITADASKFVQYISTSTAHVMMLWRRASCLTAEKAANYWWCSKAGRTHSNENNKD